MTPMPPAVLATLRRHAARFPGSALAVRVLAGTLATGALASVAVAFGGPATGSAASGTAARAAARDAVEHPAAPGDRWPGFRGLGNGHTAARGLPVRWSETEGRAWSVELTGAGQSAPVVWGGRVFVTSIEDGSGGERCLVSAFDLADGRELWSRDFPATFEIERSGTVSIAAPTPAADAELLVAFFETGDLVALDHHGELLWQRSLAREHGAPQGSHGLASSVVLADGAAYLLVDHEGPSYLLRVDARTGETAWRRERESRVSWSTPVLAAFEGEPQLVVSSSGVLEAFELAAGALRWRLGDVQGNTVESPTVVGERVLVGSSQRSDVLLVRRTPAGEPEVEWRPERARELGFASPLVAGGRVLLVGKAGALSCLSLATGELLWEERTAESCWASPIAAGERVYLFGKDGVTTVLRPDDAGPNVLAENRIEGSGRVYGAAAVDGALLVREGERLRCLRDAAPRSEADGGGG